MAGAADAPAGAAAGAPAQPQDIPPAAQPVPSALACLAVIARHHGIDLSAQRLLHEEAIALDANGAPPVLSPVTLERIAREQGLKAAPLTPRPERLPKLAEACPFIVWLRSGEARVLARIETPATGPASVLLLDPQAGTPETALQRLDAAAFQAGWTGTALLLKPARAGAKPPRRFGLRWFLPELAAEKRLFGDVIVAALFLHLVGLLVPFFFQQVIDRVLVHETITTLTVLTVGVVVAILFDSLFLFLRRWLLLHATTRIDVRVASRTFAHLLRLPVALFERAPAGVIVKHMGQADKVREFLTGRLFLTLLDATALLVFLPVLWLYSPILTGVVLAFTALTGLVVAVLLPTYRQRLNRLYAAEGERQAMLVETVHGMRTVKSLSLEPRQRRQWDDRAADAAQQHFQVGRVATLADALIKALDKLGLVAVIALGAHLIFAQSLSVGALVAFQMLMGRVSQPLVALVGLVNEYQETALSVRMLGQIMDQRAEDPRAERAAGAGRGLRPPLRGQVTFEGVTFRYGGGPVVAASPDDVAGAVPAGPAGAPALDEVSFDIPAGSMIGVVGRSGSGKTTLTRLLQGLHHPEHGLIRIDGVDLRALDLVHLRQSLGVVLQDAFLFRGTVRENIAAARPGAPFEAIVQAARLAGADEFIERLPQGYDTALEENAANLSGGQRQRLGIARALLTDPRILILDEATSALDPESEAIVQRNLKAIATGRTLIMVSHRLTSLIEADRILVLERGRVADCAPHRELLQRCLPYRQLWQQQTRAFAPPPAEPDRAT